MNIWSLVPKKLVNSLIESTTSRWLQQPEVVKLVCSIVFSGDSKNVDYKKHLQVIVNQTLGSITDDLALLIWKLYMIDERGQSNQQLQDRILLICHGSNSPKDALLLDIVKRTESHLGSTWTNRVFSWEFQSSNNSIDDYERQPTFVNTKDGFEVSLDIELIKKSVQNFNPLACFSIEEGSSLAKCESCMKHFSALYPTSEIYNSEFLLMSLASSLEIFKANGSIDLKVFIESYGLSFAVCCLSSEVSDNLSKSAKSIFGAILYFLSEESELSSSYREKSAIKLLASKIVNYFSSAGEEGEKHLPSCVCVMMALALPVVTNPGHFLNEKAIDFLLSSPSLRATELPMFQAIAKTTSENAIKELHWLLDTLTFSLSTQNDVIIYMQKGVFEYVLSLRELSSSIKVDQLILKAQETAGGSISLITRNGALSWVTNELSGTKIDSDRAATIRKLGARFVVTADEERLKNWTNGAVDDFVAGMAAQHCK